MVAEVNLTCLALQHGINSSLTKAHLLPLFVILNGIVVQE